MARDTMTAREIVESVEITASAERVFAALTTPSELLLWWGDRAVCPSTHWELDLRVGGKWLSRWKFVTGGPEFALGGEILELDPPRRLTYSWWDERYPGLPVTRVRYQIETIAGGVRLTMTHSGFDDQRVDYDDYNGGWSKVLSSLAQWTRPRFQANRDVAIHVPDLARAESFYCGVLGLALRRRTETQLEIDAGAFTLWVNRDDERRIGFIPSFDVSDRAAARLALERAGARPLPGTEHPHGFYVTDPFGFTVDVIERITGPR